jgi:hypothetical protein
VRDIGGFEDARKILDKEQVERQLDAEMAAMEGVEGEGEGEKEKERHVRAKSFGTLVEGLKRLEE